VSEAKRTGPAALLLGPVVLLWGVNWPIMKMGLAFMPPLWFAAARVSLATLCFFVLLLATGRLRRPPHADMPVVLSVGLLQTAAFLGLTHVALMFVEAGRSAILAYTTPLWVAPLSALFLREHLTRAKLLAVGLGMAGVAVLFNPLDVDYGDHRVLLGNGLLLLSAVVWATAIVHVSGHRWQASPLALMPWQMLLGALVLIPAAMMVEPGPRIDWSPELLAILFYNGPVASAFCYWAFVTVNRSFSATTTALGSLGVPVVGVFASALALGEPLTVAKLAGLVLIGIGVTVLAIAGPSDVEPAVDPK
jgi:drug/metabolite transporter (DMT)-like permease